MKSGQHVSSLAALVRKEARTIMSDKPLNKKDAKAFVEMVVRTTALQILSSKSDKEVKQEIARLGFSKSAANRIFKASLREAEIIKQVTTQAVMLRITEDADDAGIAEYLDYLNIHDSLRALILTTSQEIASDTKKDFL